MLLLLLLELVVLSTSSAWTIAGAYAVGALVTTGPVHGELAPPFVFGVPGM